MAELIDFDLPTETRTVVTRLFKKLRKQSISAEGLSLTERSTMGLLDQYKKLLASELAAMEKITTQSMSQILNHLFELGYITRQVSDTDKRKAYISLSGAGHEILIKVRNERDEWLKNAIAVTLSAEEQSILKKAIGTLTKLVDFD